MSAQRDPSKVAVMCYIPIDTVSRIRTAIEGKTVPNKVCNGRTVRKPRRAMRVSNYIVGLVEEAVSGIEPNKRDRIWRKKALERNVAARADLDRKLARERKK